MKANPAPKPSVSVTWQRTVDVTVRCMALIARPARQAELYAGKLQAQVDSAAQAAAREARRCNVTTRRQVLNGPDDSRHPRKHLCERSLSTMLALSVACSKSGPFTSALIEAERESHE